MKNDSKALRAIAEEDESMEVPNGKKLGPDIFCFSYTAFFQIPWIQHSSDSQVMDSSGAWRQCL